MKSGIYKIQNKLNDKVYVGSSKNVLNRIRQHRHQLKTQSHGNKHLQSSFNKYGINNFIFEKLESCEENILLEREEYYINLFDCLNPKYGYNKAKELLNTSGYKWPLESRLKFSEKCKGRFMSEETREKIRQANYKRIYKINPLAKYRNKKPASNKKIVYKCLDNKLLNVYKGQAEASRLNNIDDGAICKVCKGKRNTAGGFKWFDNKQVLTAYLEISMDELDELLGSLEADNQQPSTNLNG